MLTGNAVTQVPSTVYLLFPLDETLLSAVEKEVETIYNFYYRMCIVPPEVKEDMLCAAFHKVSAYLHKVDPWKQLEHQNACEIIAQQTAKATILPGVYSGEYPNRIKIKMEAYKEAHPYGK